MSADFDPDCFYTEENDEEDIHLGGEYDRIDLSEAEYDDIDDNDAEYVDDVEYVDNYEEQGRYGGISNPNAYFEDSSAIGPQQSSSRTPMSIPLEEPRTTVKRRLADTSGSSQCSRIVSPPGIMSHQE